VKHRTIAPTIISNAISTVPITREIAYKKLETLVPYIHIASEKFSIPENVLAAILYEEILHRKPIDVRTFGVAQLGLGELVKQGLPPKRELLEDDEVSVWLLASKLRRLQNETDSLKTAIILHNGHYDYYDSIKKSANDAEILSILNQEYKYKNIIV